VHLLVLESKKTGTLRLEEENWRKMDVEGCRKMEGKKGYVTDTGKIK
jgi:hypothetical protein